MVTSLYRSEGVLKNTVLWKEKNLKLNLRCPKREGRESLQILVIFFEQGANEMP